MKRLLFVLAILGSANALPAEIEFTGYASFDGRLLFSVTDKTNSVSSWVGLGGVFAGSRVSDFSPEKEILTLEGTPEPLYLHLRQKSPAPSSTDDFKARDRRLVQALQEKQRSSGMGKSVGRMEEYLELATRFDRVVISVETKDGEEIVTMDVPDHLRARAQNGGAEQRLNFKLKRGPSGGKPAQTLVIH